MSKHHEIQGLALAALLLITSGEAIFSAEPFPQEEFVANISASEPEWRPHYAYNADEAQILSAIFEGLFIYDPFDLEPIPALAESWTSSEDGCEWNFRLREGARFSTGEIITAEHFRHSWIALLDPSMDAPYASLLDSVKGANEYRTGKEIDPSTIGIVAKDDRTLQVFLNARAEHLPKILCHHAFSVLHPRDIGHETYKTQTTRQIEISSKKNIDVPVSSGAFTITKITDDEIRFEKNLYYWDVTNVAIPSLRIILSDDPEALTGRFNRGEIHWLAGAVNVAKVLDTNSIHISPMFATEYFFFRTTWGYGSNKDVRNALLMAVPWSELRNNYLIPATTLVFPIAGYPQIEGIVANNSNEAARLLYAAGITDPSSEPPLIISIPEAESFKNLATILKTAWEALGLKVEIRTTPYGIYYNNLRKDDYSLGITSWIGDFADPLSFLDMFRPDSSLNDSGWNNSAYEKIITDASSKKKTTDRYELLAEAEKLLLAEGIILPIAHNPSFNIIELNGLSGWYPNALDMHPFKFLRFIPGKPLPGVALLDTRPAGL